MKGILAILLTGLVIKGKSVFLWLMYAAALALIMMGLVTISVYLFYTIVIITGYITVKRAYEIHKYNNRYKSKYTFK